MIDLERQVVATLAERAERPFPIEHLRDRAVRRAKEHTQNMPRFADTVHGKCCQYVLPRQPPQRRMQPVNATLHAVRSPGGKFGRAYPATRLGLPR